MSYQPLFLGLGTAVFRTNTNTNILEGETANLRVGQLIKFVSEGNGFIFGGVAANTVYYIREIVNSDEFTISATLNGAELELNDGEGFMLVRPIQREQSTESLRKIDEMLEKIYSEGVGGGVGIGGDIDGGDADSSFDESTVGDGILSVVEDETPALGGNLSLNGKTIFGTGAINMTGTINATVVAGNLRGTVAGGLIGPVDEEGVRTGNPTIDGLPFELGNPQGGQVISWDASNQKFTLVSVSAVSGTDTLDDVLFRGNTSSNSITVSSLTTDTLVVNNGLNYSVIVNPPTIPVDISDLTDTTSLLGATSLSVITADSTEISDVTTLVFTGAGVTVSSAGNAVTLDITGGVSANTGNFTFTNSTASVPLGDTLILQTNQSGGNRESVLTLNPISDSALDVGGGLRLRTAYGTGFEQSWTFNTNGSITFPDATTQTTAYIAGTSQVGLGSRTTASATTGALLVNATGDISITGFKTYALLAITVEIPAWVRLYTSSNARTADASRLETEDPLPGSGVIAEVITTSNNQTVLFTPAIIGFNGATPATTTIFAAVKNKGGGLATIEVTLNLLQLEA
jgi:hypothetical protein